MVVELPLYRKIINIPIDVVNVAVRTASLHHAEKIIF